MNQTPFTLRSALGVAMMAGLAGFALPRTAHAGPVTASSEAAPGGSADAALPAQAVPPPTVVPVPALFEQLPPKPSLNALRVDLRTALNALELGYERAVSRRIGVFAAASMPYSLHQRFNNDEIAGTILGGTLGARFYPVGGDSTFSGLVLTPFVDATYLRGSVTHAGERHSGSLTLWGAGATVGYSWTPGDVMVVAVSLGAEATFAPSTTIILPVLTLGVGPTF